MAHQNSIIKSDYTIDVASAIEDEYSCLTLPRALVYESDFNNSAIDQLPAGWSAQDNDGAEVKSEITGDATSNRALLIRGQRIGHALVDDPPIPSIQLQVTDKFRWASLVQTFSVPIFVKFKAYQGRTGGLYSTIEPTDPGENLWLQYKVGSGQWQNAGDPLVVSSNPNGGSWDLNFVVTRSIGIDSGVDANNPLSLRWINRTNAGNDEDENDTWVIDDIEIYGSESLEAIPRRFTFFGAPNLRGQTATEAHKTFLGKVRV